MSMRKSKDLDFEEYVDNEYYYNETGDSSIVDEVEDYETNDVYDEEESKKYDAIGSDYEEFKKISEEVEDEKPEVTVTVNNTKYSSNNNYRKNNVVKERKVKSYEREEDEEDYETVPILSFISTWVGRIGIIIAIILIIYFLATAQFKNLFFYIFGLILAYFFGYFFMFLLMSNDEKSKE